MTLINFSYFFHQFGQFKVLFKLYRKYQDKNLVFFQETLDKKKIQSARSKPYNKIN
jgi:hypothetical protein